MSVRWGLSVCSIDYLHRTEADLHVLEGGEGEVIGRLLELLHLFTHQLFVRFLIFNIEVPKQVFLFP